MAKKLSGFVEQRANANKHTDRGLKMLNSSIKDNGWIGAITTANDGETFDGSAGLNTALNHFGKDVEPIIVESDGTRPIVVKRTDIASAGDPKAKKLAIAANRIAQIDLAWDAEILAEIADEVDLTDLFLEEELSAIIGETNTQKEDEDEDALESALNDVGKVESRVKLGEIWQLGRHKIACGDSTVESNVRALLGDRFGDVGMVWSDPPYNTKQQQGRTSSQWGIIDNDSLTDQDFTVFIQSFINVIAIIKAPSLYVCCHWKSYPLFFALIPNINSLIVWVKNNFGLGSGYRPKHELIIFKGKIESNSESNVWEISKDASSSYKHPMQKPVELIEKAFTNSSNSNDLIFDPFLGSAPSIIAAQKMDGDRTVYGFELSEDYCEVIIKRFEDFSGETAKLIGRIEDV